MDRSVPVTIPVDQLTSGGQEYGLVGLIGLVLCMLLTENRAGETKLALWLNQSRCHSQAISSVSV